MTVIVDGTNGITTPGVTNSGSDSIAVDLSFNSGFGSSGIAYGCRAWVNFNGATSPPTIRASANVTSVTKNATGTYTILFTNAMPDANFCAVGNAGQAAGTISRSPFIKDKTTTTAKVYTSVASTGALIDVEYCEIAVFR